MTKTREIHEVASIRERLRQAGLQTTAVRLAVIRLLIASNSTMSCAQIANAIIPFGFQRSALPKVLGRLVKTGIIQTLDHGWRPKQFQWTGTPLIQFEFERNGVAIADLG